MPIMTPVADIVGVSRQTAVLAYCFGDGFSDMFWPTACTLNCGLMGCLWTGGTGLWPPVSDHDGASDLLYRPVRIRLSLSPRRIGSEEPRRS